MPSWCSVRCCMGCVWPNPDTKSVMPLSHALRHAIAATNSENATLKIDLFIAIRLFPSAVAGPALRTKKRAYAVSRLLSKSPCVNSESLTKDPLLVSTNCTHIESPPERGFCFRIKRDSSGSESIWLLSPLDVDCLFNSPVVAFMPEIDNKHAIKVDMSGGSKA